MDFGVHRLFPAFFVFASNALTYWKEQGRAALTSADVETGWLKRVDANSYTFTLVFVLLVVFAGGVQWMSVRLFPLLVGKANYTTDWGSLAIEHPEVITTIEAIIFTGVAYLAMCLFFFGFYAALILIVTMAQDFAKLVGERKANNDIEDPQHIDRIGRQIADRCVPLFNSRIDERDEVARFLHGILWHQHHCMVLARHRVSF